MFKGLLNLYVEYAGGVEDFFAFNFAPEILPWLQELADGYSKNKDAEFLSSVFPMYWKLYSETSNDCIDGKILLGENNEPVFVSVNEARV